MPINHEPTFNTKLAEVLRGKHPRWRKHNKSGADIVISESSGVLQSGGTPDILLNLITPLVIESEFMPAGTVEEDAVGRLGKKMKESGKIIEQVIALRIPAAIKEISESRLKRTICKSQFEYCLLSINAEGAPVKRWPKSGWLKGGVDELVALIENAAITEKLIAENLKTLEGAVAGAGATLLKGTADCPEVNERIAKLLCQSEGEQTVRMAMAIVSNAITFHRILGGKKNVQHLSSIIRNKRLLVGYVVGEWSNIVDNINYFPVFDIALKILCEIPEKTANDILTLLEEQTREFFDSGLMSGQDIYGRMFQRLITDRKFLATFYTLPESAQLLAEIALHKLQIDFTDEAAAPKIRIADFACGTGTLINAAYHSVLARHRRAGHDDEKIHQPMIEKSLIATDIMPAGVHLALSILASVHPQITFGGTQTSVLPYGATQTKQKDKKGKPIFKVELGALDLIEDELTVNLLHKETTLGGKGEHTSKSVGEGGKLNRKKISHDYCDLVIMNPPFTRPGNFEVTDKPVPSFAGFSTSDKEQRMMADRLKEINLCMPNRAGHGNAGLASNFIDLADRKLKKGGVLALVIPAIFASGAGWARSRNFINANYDDITIISLVSSDAKSTAFSADTAISEILLIAKKRQTPRTDGYAKVQFISLGERPKSTMQAHIIAKMIGELNGNLLESIWAGDDYLGEIACGNLTNGGAVGVLDISLFNIALQLSQGTLNLPRETQVRKLPITRLGKIAERGFYHLQIKGKNTRTGEFLGPFDIEPIRPHPTYPCLSAHRCELERCFIVQPDTQGRVRKGMKKAADKVWVTASTLHFGIDFRLNANSLVACVTEIKTIGGRAWPNVRPIDASHEPAIVLWENSTLGLLLWWHSASRQQAGRASFTISRLMNLSTLDTRKLTANQHKLAAKIFDRFKQKPFLPANEIYHDETRHALDHAVLIELLGLPESILEPLDILRKKWCFEPSVHGGKSTRIDAGQTTQTSMEE